MNALGAFVRGGAPHPMIDANARRNISARQPYTAPGLGSGNRQRSIASVSGSHGFRFFNHQSPTLPSE
jgi:hypothetical protein